MSESPMNVRGNQGSEREPIPPGAHAARCSIVAGIGPQHSPQFGTKPQVILVWDLAGKTVEWEDDQGNKQTGPMRLSGFYNLTLGSSTRPSNLRKLLEGWRGKPFTADEEKGFQLANVAGAACLLMVAHKNRADGSGVVDYVSAASRANNNDVPPLPEPAVFFDPWEWDAQAFARLPEWIQQRVVDPNHAETGDGPPNDDGAPPPDMSQDMAEDDIPF